MNAPVRGYARLPDGGRLAYACHGWKTPNVTPIMLLRPLGGTMALWGTFVDQLAREFPVLAFDYRGAGGSSSAPLWVTTRVLAADALCVLDHLELDRVHVFGISLGAMVATWLAHLAPDRVERLCLASAGVRGLSLLPLGFREAVGLAACFAQRTSCLESCLVRRVLSPGFRAAHPAEVHRIEALVAEQPSTRLTLLKYATAAGTHNAANILSLSQVRVPTLVLAGAEDHVIGPSPSRQLALRIAGAQFEIVPGVGHDLTLEDPLGTAARVAAFFQLPYQSAPATGL